MKLSQVRPSLNAAAAILLFAGTCTGLSASLSAQAPAGAAHATAAAATPQPVGPAAEVQASYARFKANILKAAEKMPAADYGYKLTPEIRSFARVVNHITEAQLHTCTALNGTKFDQAKVPGDAVGKEAVIAGLKGSFEECDRAYAAVNDKNLAETVDLFSSKRSRIGAAWANVSHDNEQYAHLSLYLRGKNLIPPTSEK